MDKVSADELQEQGQFLGTGRTFFVLTATRQSYSAYLSQIVAQMPLADDKQVYVTNGEQVLSNPRKEDNAALNPCGHVAHAAHHGHSKILIRTVDTDVVAIAVRIIQLLEALQQLWIAFGTGKSFRYLADHEIAAAMGPLKALAIPMLHALTGCDTVSAFTSRGKRTAWITWNSFPELMEALLSLSFTPHSIPEETMKIMERFVILMYDKTS